MAIDTLTTCQYSLERKEQKLKDLTTKVWFDPLMALARDGKGMVTIKSHGRALTAYFNGMLYPGGAKGIVAESGTYPAPQAESAVQASVVLKLFAMTISYTEHLLKALESDPSRLKDSLNSKVRRSVEGMQRYMADLFAGRGDGTIGRAAAAGGGSTAIITLDQPPLCSPGDLVYSNPTRAFATAGGESGYIEGARVADVDYDAKTITLAANDTWDDADVIHFAGAAENSGGATNWPQGLQAAYDDADVIVYDADDAGAYDHCDTYLGLTRSATTQAKAKAYNINGYPTLAKIQRLVTKSVLNGGNPKNMVSLWNPLTYEKYCESIEGYAPKSTVLKLPGGNFEVPVITKGITQLPCIISHRIPDDKITVVDKSKMYRLTAPGGWNKRDGKMWKQVIDSTATGTANAKAEYQAFFDVWYQLAVFLSCTSTVGYGVTTT